MLVIDTSSSMGSSGIADAIRGANSFLDNLKSSKALVGLATFGPSGVIRHDLTESLDDVRRSVKSLTSGGGTPLTDALQKTHDALKKVRGQRVVVVLSDGSPNDSNSALSVGDAIKKDDIRIIAIGAGSADYVFLRKLASDPSGSIESSFSDLSNTFGRIARSLGSQTSTGLRRLGNG